MLLSSGGDSTSDVVGRLKRLSQIFKAHWLEMGFKYVFLNYGARNALYLFHIARSRWLCSAIATSTLNSFAFSFDEENVPLYADFSVESWS